MPEQVDGSKTAELVPLSVLALDLPERVVEATALEHRGIEVLRDDLGRAAITRRAARLLFVEALAEQELTARKREAIEEQAIEAHQRFLASLPAGIPAGAVPAGVDAGQWMMLNDPAAQSAKRESVLQHALSNEGNAVFHSLQPEQAGR